MFIAPPPHHRVFNIPKASPEFSLRVDVTPDEGSDDEPVRGEATVMIVSRASHRIVQTIRMPSIVIFKDQICTSVARGGNQPRLYDDDYSFVFEDFNFDGHKDLAICKDMEGSYGAMSYDIFVWNPSRHRFLKDAQLSKLSSEHLGLVLLDPRKREVITADKSGAAWHLVSTYKYFGRRLRLVETEEDDDTGPREIITTKHRVGNKWRTRIQVNRSQG